MAGLYIHIPFCKQACHYCNFHFSTSLKLKERLVQALLKEIDLQRDYLKDRNLSSIYLGGGTPSLLSKDELDAIFEKIDRIFCIQKNAEITLEANPDDLNSSKIDALRQTPINRLSIGIQSFSDADLKYMNRAHNQTEAIQCLKNAQQAGFQNLSIDLIYGTPTMSQQQWITNIQQVLDFDIPHISCYSLTVEPRTALAHFVQSGQYQAPQENAAAQQMEYLVNILQQVGYIHYEISNFAKPDALAKHNSNYWLGEPYLGIGPAAHSFDGTSRQWNVAHNMQYIKAIEAKQVPFEREVLSPNERYNEYVMTALRTVWGCDLQRITAMGEAYQQHFLEQIRIFCESNAVARKDNIFTLTMDGKLLADHITAKLFV